MASDFYKVAKIAQQEKAIMFSANGPGSGVCPHAKERTKTLHHLVHLALNKKISSKWIIN